MNSKPSTSSAILTLIGFDGRVVHRQAIDADLLETIADSTRVKPFAFSFAGRVFQVDPRNAALFVRQGRLVATEQGEVRPEIVSILKDLQTRKESR